MALLARSSRAAMRSAASSARRRVAVNRVRALASRSSPTWSASRAPSRSAVAGGKLPKFTYPITGDVAAQEHVNNLLYNTPEEGGMVDEKNVFSVLVDNEPGVLAKITGLLSARGFNIDSLTVTSTLVPELSRMTIVMKGPEKQMTQAKRQLEDVVNVWHVFDYTKHSVINRELALIKVRLFPPELAGEDLDAAAADDFEEGYMSTADVDAEAETVGPSKGYADLMSAHFHREAVMQQAKLFNAEVVDVGSEHMTLELSSWSRRIDAFIEMLRPFGIVESSRSGVVAMPRSPVAGMVDGAGDEEVGQEQDLAALPPS